MIAHLQGKLLSIEDDALIINVNGVGYRTYVVKTALQTPPQLGSEVTLHIETIVREDAITLYGFSSPQDVSLFRKLLTVNGVGPKVALNILAALPAANLANAIFQGDLARLTAISGIGKKTAERIIIELKDKMLNLMTTPFANESNNDAVSAFVNLGYNKHEAEKVLASIEGAANLPLASLVKEGLKRLSNRI